MKSKVREDDEANEARSTLNKSGEVDVKFFFEAVSKSQCKEESILKLFP